MSFNSKITLPRAQAKSLNVSLFTIPPYILII